MKKLYLDDIRQVTDTFPEADVNEWELVKNYEQFENRITVHGLPSFISFDHDLGDVGSYDPNHKEKTGMTCALFLTEYCQDHSLKLPEWNCHSSNPTGRANIESLLANFERFQKANGIE